jgi:hypothetical protein
MALGNPNWVPGVSGNPNGYHGPRNGSRHRRHKEIFERIKGLGHEDALVTLSSIQNDTNADPNLRIAAAAALAPFAHPKLQAMPVPRFIDNPIDVPDFTSVEVAEAFLGKLTVLVARGELDFQSGLELSTMTQNWLATQISRATLDLKAQAQGTSDHEQIIRIEGGLPPLPGTNVNMGKEPSLNGHAALAAAIDDLTKPAVLPAPASGDRSPVQANDAGTDGAVNAE